MANEAFALSPISASAALPSADDYQAISDAFMETSRGRWFLTEYARRNRNADTAMVLEAVARIEATIATQKQVAASTTLAEAAATMRSFVAQASAAATDALDHFVTSQDFMPTRRGVRIIREVAWRLREVGYDGRICDILEAQANAIDTNHDPSVAQGLRGAVLQAFEMLDRRIADLAGEDGTMAEAPPSGFAPEVRRGAAMPEDATEAREPDGPAAEAVAPAVQTPDTDASAPPEDHVADQDATAAYSAPLGEAIDVAAQTAADLSLATAPIDLQPPPAPMPEPMPVEIAEESAAEMPPAETAYSTDTVGPDAGETAVQDLRDAVAPTPQAMAQFTPELDIDTSLDADLDADAELELDIAAASEAVATPVQPPRPSSLIPPNTLSLGESLLARGMVAAPAAKTDPLAPIRRMSQAEKIAFFS